MSNEKYYSNAFPPFVYPSSGKISKYDTNDFLKVMDCFFSVTDFLNAQKLFRKPMNLVVSEDSKNLIIGINFDKSIVGYTSISTFNASQSKTDYIEKEMTSGVFDELGFNINGFIKLPFSLLDKVFDKLIKIFQENQDPMQRALTLMLNADIDSNLKSCVEIITKSISSQNTIYGGNGMWVHPIFRARELTVDNNMCFCVLPFNDARLGIFDKVIKPTLEKEFDVNVIRSGNIFTPNLNIMESIWTYINQAAFVIADLSDRNPNVFYELGICHTLGKPVITLCDEESYNNDYHEKLPFDISSINTIFYQNSMAGSNDLVEGIKKNVKALRSGKPYIE